MWWFLPFSLPWLGFRGLGGFGFLVVSPVFCRFLPFSGSVFLGSEVLFSLVRLDGREREASVDSQGL